MSISSAVPPAPPLAPSLRRSSAAGQDAFMSALRSSLSLDGEWTFQFGDGTPQTIMVPAPWESVRPELLNKAGTAIYEKRFSVPEDFAGKRVVLRFGAVDYFTEVWLNDRLIGSHDEGYT